MYVATRRSQPLLLRTVADQVTLRRYLETLLAILGERAARRSAA